MSNNNKIKSKSVKVAVIMGSDSDYSVMADAVAALDKFGVESHVEVVSAHRTPLGMVEFAKNAVANGYKVIIAGAGGAAHLPGMVASITTLPVIGVPVLTKSLSGIDSLYSIAQMPPGIPVLTMAINGAKNAGLAAVKILATSDNDLAKKLNDYKKELVDVVGEMNKGLGK